ncbi:MAG: hypothetical protein LBV68_03770 [Spirochaetaceae bacterium]|jgi:glucosamine-6-phosphate deaminase|nr:hypothetical protein [Spirochaetaceae bacterium]
MYEYKIAREDLYRWCCIPADALEKHPDKKVKLVIKDTKDAAMDRAGNMMADEVKANNAAGKATTWVLPAGPAEPYTSFIKRINTERISLKNLTVYHMDYVLDWNSRVYPFGNYFESPHGRMHYRFYEPVDRELRVPEEQRIWPELGDLDRIDREIEEIGGVDTVWAGVGYKGMVAFCEAPHNPYERVSLAEYAAMKTRIVNLNDDMIIAMSVRNFGGLYDKIPHQGVTIGMKSMLSAKRCVLMLQGSAWKQTVLRVILFSEATTEYPVTLFADHVPDCTLISDRDTAEHPLSRALI